MNEDTLNGHRIVAWMDGLTDEERLHIQRLSELPSNMQVGMVWVDFNRQMDDLRDEHRQAMKSGTIIRNIASGTGGGLLVALAYLGHAMGFDKVLR
jgi:hypothetical protein